MLETFYDKPRSVYSIKLQKYLYGLKQSSRMWYNHLNEYLLEKGFENNKICPCIFIKKTISRFVIVAVYVDGLNLVGTPKELIKTATYLKDEFVRKISERQNFILIYRLNIFQIEYLFINRYIEKVLKHFYMDNAHSLSTSMIVGSLDVKKYPFWLLEEDEEIPSPKVLCLSVIEALMYLANAGYLSIPIKEDYKHVIYLSMEVL